ncbi:hypothetical protein D3C83_317500 [compost metagenome]
MRSAKMASATAWQMMRARISLLELRRLSSPPRAMLKRPKNSTPSVASMARTSRMATNTDIDAI